MAKYKTGPSKESEQAALKVAKATQRPGQTKEQTKLIAQGIQKGIEQYKKQQKSKSRELDRKLKSIKKTSGLDTQLSQSEHNQQTSSNSKKNLLPWLLLVISWGFFAGYAFLLA